MPLPQTEPARYWVHQYKLTEGIDDAAFRLVAFYQPFSSERAFVQQIGRVLRNPGREPGQYASVIYPAWTHLDESWIAYRAYDQESESGGLAPGPREFARSQPNSQYLDRRFRVPFDLDGSNLHLEFNYPLSVLAYEIPSSFDLDQLTRSVVKAFDDADFEQGSVEHPDPEARVHPYIAVQNSPLLRSSAFAEYEVGLCVYRRVGKYLSFFDSQGTIPDALPSLGQVPPDLLRRLYAGAKKRG